MTSSNGSLPNLPGCSKGGREQSCTVADSGSSGNELARAVSSLTQGENLLHLFCLAMSLTVLSLSWMLQADDQRGVFFPGTSIAMPTTCSSKLLLGIECPGCGLTRAFIAISHGRLGRAWELNRMSMLVYLFVLGQIPWHLTQLSRRLTGRRPMDWFGVYLIPIALAILLVVNWILKLALW